MGNMMLLGIDVRAYDGDDWGQRHRVNDIEFLLHMADILLAAFPKRQVILDDGHPRFATGIQLAAMNANSIDYLVMDVLVAF